MAQGLRVWNADGTLQFDSGNRLLRTLTSIDVSNDGNYTMPDLPVTGVVVGVDSAAPADAQIPTVSVSGKTISWTYNGASKRAASKLNIMAY